MIQSRKWTESEKQRRMSMLSGKDGHNIFVYGTLQEPQVVNVLLNRVPDNVSAVLSGFHRFRIKDRVYPTILRDGTREVTGKVIKGITDDELKMLDEFEDVEYDKKAVEVVLTDTSEKLQVETYVWKKKDDPDLYGEWDFEEWKRQDKEDFVTATKKFLEERRLPEAKTRMDTFKTFFQEDIKNERPLDA